MHCKKNVPLAAFFSNKQAKIAREFAKISALIPRWRERYQAAVRAGELDSLAAVEFKVYPQYLEKAFSSGDRLWLDLYVGEKIKQAYAVDGNVDNATAQIGAVLDEEMAYLTDAAKTEGLVDELVDLQNALNLVRTVVTAKSSQSLKVLWIADCLYLDIQSFLAGALASNSLSLQPDFVTTKNPNERFEQVVALLRSNVYDAIFYCPFSYENSSAYACFLDARRAFSNIFSVKSLSDYEFSAIEPLIQLLSEKAECPVFIHNASGVMRHLGSWKDSVKDLITRSARMAFCRAINRQLEDLTHRLNRLRPVSQIVIFDEFAVAKANGLRLSGSYFHHYGLQHPARLGLYMVDMYLDALLAVRTLLKKKVVVCDLDYTLWDGMIGEGAVVHHLDRQQALKSLKKKGVLLAINSKNNADNVNWDGSVLNHEDFAGVRINWNTKAENIGELAEEMNLKTNSFVFVDDRPDERAMVASIYPGTLTLDANDPATWRRLDTWERMLSTVGAIDRTEMYKNRLQREKFVSSSPQLPKTSLFEQLELKCSVALSDKKSLPRIAELLNRTNQFNTTGRRTSLREVQSWHEDPNWSIYIANARDRFGDMGLVSVLVAHDENREIAIEAFVLSCRVFGYGIETALLKALIDANLGKTISGLIVPTSINQPCQSVYAVNNFRQDRNRWIFDAQSAPIANKDWLTVESKFDSEFPRRQTADV